MATSGRVRGVATETVEITVGGKTIKVSFTAGAAAADMQMAIDDAVRKATE
jgi:ribosome-associated translation inhibitor RaiA